MGYNSKKNRKNYIKRRTSTERHMLLSPIYFILAIVPFVSRLHAYDPKMIEYPFFYILTESIDVFLYWKQWLFVAACAVLVIIIAIRAYIDKKTIKFKKIYLPLAIYALLAFLSTIFSKYTYFGFAGISDQFENVLCLLGYMIIPYYLYLIIEDEEDVKTIVTALAAGAALLAAIGLSQALGKDFWFTSLGNNIMSGGDPMELTMEKNRAYMSQFNPNYVGSYVGLVAPMFLVLVLCSKKIKEIIPYGLIFAALIVVLLSSKADSGIIGVTLSLFFVVIFLRRILIKRWYAVAAAIIIAAGAIFAAGKFNNVNYLKNAVNDVKNSLKVEKRESPKLEDIITGTDALTIINDGNTLVFKASNTLEDLWFQFYDGNGESVNYIASENNTYSFEDERYRSITMSLEFIEYEYGFYVDYNFYINGQAWTFTNTIDDNGFYYLNSMYRYVKIETQHTNILKGYEHIMSNRGFLWAHTIPLLKSNIFLGTGADTFTLAYPQYDYINMRNHGYGGTTIISKPHNMYLQTGVQTGLLSLVSLLVFYGLYFLWCVKLYINNKFESFLPQAGAAIFIGTISYMAIGIVNDSTITVAPVFWTLIGLGTSINFLVKKQIAEQAVIEGKTQVINNKENEKDTNEKAELNKALKTSADAGHETYKKPDDGDKPDNNNRENVKTYSNKNRKKKR